MARRLSGPNRLITFTMSERRPTTTASHKITFIIISNLFTRFRCRLHSEVDMRRQEDIRQFKIAKLKKP